ncbi:ISAs1 family transposase [Daejeonia sp. YH14]|uniref:ISAs1 family transposase n=1 Tax=Daejeonia sp. YH14 TaxID=3439042 RepID=UPI003F494AF1
MDANLKTIFSSIRDNKRDITKYYELNDILLMAILAVICGADSWNDIEEYCIAKEDWLIKLLDLQNGIPSHDTFNRVISRIDHQEFERCFMEWTALLVAQPPKKEIINMDGKTICGAKEHGNKSPIHIVSAWACENNIVLGHIKTNHNYPKLYK